jgi:hypothetical protein|tara:strand:+ start:353 stop:535 length:183 start_codon:yes stop_codon:yes gene_type:complete
LAANVTFALWPHFWLRKIVRCRFDCIYFLKGASWQHVFPDFSVNYGGIAMIGTSIAGPIP